MLSSKLSDMKLIPNEKRAANREAVRRYRERNRKALNAEERQRRRDDPEYLEKRRAQIRKSVAKWKAKNPEKARSATKRWYDANAAYCRKKARRYYAENTEARIAYSRRYHKLNGDQQRATMKRIHRRVKDEVFAAYGGYRCACKKCQETNPKFLTIDHINGCTPKMRKKQGNGSQFYRWLKNNGFPKGFRVLCFNCNIGRALNGGVCPHLTSTAR